MGWVVAGSVLLQIYYLYTCAIVWMVTIDGGWLFEHHPLDENLLGVLVIAKVVLAPVSFVLLGARPAPGKVFTGALFLTYGVCGLAMPLFAGSPHPMAWWPNARAAGEGPFISMIFIALGVLLAFHKRIARLNQTSVISAPPPAA